MFARTKLSLGLLAAFGSLSVLAPAAQAQNLERVEITGSSIRRSIANEGALPISVYKASELREAGVTTVEGVVARIAASQSSLTGSQSIGSGTGGASVADLRGLGANKTLILLNGRRVANFAFDSSYVDLNSIPFAVIDRIEVLRDGASAIYGTDAIGGVINFITKRNFNGVELAAELSRPRAAGGDEERQSFTLGFGDLQTNGFNIWGAIDKHKQQSVAALDRKFASTGIIEDRGLFKISGTTFPGNFTQTQADGSTLVGNPSEAGGCAPPLSVPLGDGRCVFDYSGMIDIIPETEQTTMALRGTIKLPGDALLSAEYAGSQSQNIARVASDPVGGIVLAPGNPFYPTTFPGIDPTRNISAGWRMIPAGKRTNEANATADRFVIDLRGSVGGTDYTAGMYASESRVSDGATDGYVNARLIRQYVNEGRLNPFGTATPAQIALIETAKMRGTFATATGSTRGVDLRLSRDLFEMGGGAAAGSVGVEARREDYRNDTDDNMVNNVPSAGRSPYHAGGGRDIVAVTGELLLPIARSFEVSLAARFDKYSDAGSTFNPKIGFKFQPTKAFLLRGSANTGFRAPSLDEMWGPQSVTYSENDYDDPLLCPGGTVAAGGVSVRDCGMQVQRLTGGNPDLKPEKSKTFSLGFAIEPARNLTFSMDYWNIRLTNQILAFPEQAVMADASKYASRYVRCNQLSAAEQERYDRCLNDWAGSNALAYVVTLTDNLGGLKTDGIDLTAAYGLSFGSAGNLALSYDGTYVRSYQYQRTESDPYIEMAGRYEDGWVAFRWQHNIGARWDAGRWAAQLNVRHKTGYTDENLVEPEYYNKVKGYTLVDVSATVKPIKNLSLTLGVKNLFDKDPPFTNQGSTFQQGYDPRYTDPLGRTYTLRGSLSF